MPAPRPVVVSPRAPHEAHSGSRAALVRVPSSCARECGRRADAPRVGSKPTGGTVRDDSMTSAHTGHGDTFAGDATLEVVALGGLREFGMNLMAISYGDTCLVVDAGVSFPDVEQI